MAGIFSYKLFGLRKGQTNYLTRTSVNNCQRVPQNYITSLRVRTNISTDIYIS